MSIDWTPLADKDVWIFPDNDIPGRKYASEVAQKLAKLSPPARVKIIELPGLPPKGDMVDWVDSHGDLYVAEVTLSGGGRTGAVPGSCHSFQKFVRD